MRAVNDRDRLAPVTLPAEHPVAQLIIHLAFADILFDQEADHGFLGVGDAHSVDKTGIDQNALIDLRMGSLLNIAAGNDLNDGQAESPCKLPVPRVVAGHRHDGPRAVAHQYIIRYPDGDLLPVDGVDRRNALDGRACLPGSQLGAFKITLAGGLGPVFIQGIHVGDAARHLLDQGMLR